MHQGPIIAIEPNIKKLPLPLERIIDLKTVEEALAELDIAVLLVDHKPFRQLSRQIMNQFTLVDTRGIWI